MFLISELSVLCPSIVTFQKEKSNPINVWPAFPLGQWKWKKCCSIFFIFFLYFRKHWLKNADKIITTWRTGKERISTVFFTYLSTAVVLSYLKSRHHCHSATLNPLLKWYTLWGDVSLIAHWITCDVTVRSRSLIPGSLSSWVRAPSWLMSTH